MDKLQDNENTTPLDTIKKHPITFGRSQQSIDSGPSSIVKKSLFGIQRNMSVPNATESNLPGLIKKQQAAIARGTPPPVPPNKPVIAPKKDLTSFIKKPSIPDNAISSAEKDQKVDSVHKHNSFLTNDIATSDKQEELVKN